MGAIPPAAGKKLFGLTAALILSGCASVEHYTRHPDEAWTIKGPPVTDNTTPLEGALQCTASMIKSTGKAPAKITVGNIKDYTGKFSEAEGGNPITQGGALMVISALGKMQEAVRLHERFDTQVTEVELRYLDRRYLGDGEVHKIRDNGMQQVPWKPYYGGTIMETDYFIVGGITELNYNIQSGGAELAIDGMGPKGRQFTMNIAADLRVVETQTLEVVKTTSLQKQITGYEISAEIFEFFDDLLVDFRAGVKSQEPLQLGVRTTLELGVVDLLGAIYGVDPRPCVTFDGSNKWSEISHNYARIEPAAAEQQQEQTFVVYFEEGSASLMPDALSTIDDAVAAAKAGEPANLLLEGHADAKGSEVYNLELSRQRAAVVRGELVSRGIASGRISMVWYGESQLAVETGDDVSEPMNRRVVIQILEDDGAT